MKRATIITSWTRRAAWMAGVLLLGLLLGSCEPANPAGKDPGGTRDQGEGTAGAPGEEATPGDQGGASGENPQVGATPGDGPEAPSAPPPPPKCPIDSTITTITTEAGLKAIDSKLDGKYCIEADITLTPNWEPLGTFTGTLDGNGYTISGLTIDKPGTDNVGFFSELGVGATVKDLSFDRPDVKGKDKTGVLAGTNGSTIENIKIEGGSVEGKIVGGLVGQNNKTITSSYATGKVTGTGDDVGGLVGVTSSSSTIKNSYTTGEVSGFYNVGGFVGRNRGAIENSYATGKVTTTTTNNVGGLVGINIGSNSTITSSYYDKMSTGQGMGIGKDYNSQVVQGFTEAPVQGAFIGWDFTDTWFFAAGKWPILKWQTATTP